MEVMQLFQAAYREVNGIGPEVAPVALPPPDNSVSLLRQRMYGPSRHSGVLAELDKYFSEALVMGEVNLLDYWWARTDLPGIQKLARKFLCIPRTSTPVEHVFSGARRVVADNCASLAPATIRDTMLAKYWMRDFLDIAVKDYE